MEERMIDMPEEIEEQEQGAAPAKYSLGGGIGAFLAMGAVDVFAHLGPTGLIVAAIVGIAAYRHTPEVVEQVAKEIPLPKRSPKQNDTTHEPERPSLWQRALGFEQVIESDDLEIETEELPFLSNDESSVRKSGMIPQEWSVSLLSRLLPTPRPILIKFSLVAH